MKEKFEYIILPPDHFHFSLRDRLSDARYYIQNALDVVYRLCQPNEKIIVKYRSTNQMIPYPTNIDSRVGYGKVLDFCLPDSIVIGMPNSATIECLLNDIYFFPFFDPQKVKENGLFDQEALIRFTNLFYISRNKEELFENIFNKKIFRPGKSKDLLISKNTAYLDEIITIIIKGQVQS